MTRRAGEASTHFGLQSGRCLVQCHHQRSRNIERYLHFMEPAVLPCDADIKVRALGHHAVDRRTGAERSLTSVVQFLCRKGSPECGASGSFACAGGVHRDGTLWPPFRPCRWQGDRLCLRSGQIQYNALQAANVRKVMLHCSHNYGVPRAASLGRQIERNARHDQI